MVRIRFVPAASQERSVGSESGEADAFSARMKRSIPASTSLRAASGPQRLTGSNFFHEMALLRPDPPPHSQFSRYSPLVADLLEPGIGAQGSNSPGLAEQPIPGVTAGVDDLVSGLEEAMREAIVSEMQP